MNKTSIEWVKNPDGTQGYTWNPITGCLNGCPYCYARKLANGRLKQRYLANNNGAPQEDILDYGRDMKDPFYPRFWEERLGDIKRGYHYIDWSGACEHGASLKGIFVCDMSDLFGIGIPDQWTRQILETIKRNGKDRFYLLTKQPQNLIKFSPFPENCWVGVTATDSKMAWNAYVDLAAIYAPIKFLSLEPLLEQIDTRMIANFKGYINWVIIGAQTKPTVYPKIEWVEEIVEACDKAFIPVFLKNNLEPLFELERKSDVRLLRLNKGNWELRQELPE